MSQRLAAQELGIAQSTLNGLLKSRVNLEVSTECGGRKRKREGKSQATDEALFIWFQQATLQNASINRSILMDKANSLAKELNEDFQATDGWLTRWKERHGIVHKKLQGEKADGDECKADDWVTIDDDLPVYHTRTMDDREIADAVLEGREKEANNSTFPGEDNDGDKGEEEEEERIPVKRPEVSNAVNLLRRALEENEVGDLYFTTLNEIEAKLLAALPQKQSVITDVFRK
ncbi:hypothetical protein V9T40_013708 [Parthenolecanium corni]|uniref:HTH CENPB-type domain-containing protein n=1 Tax=Parthenolecanium corni TaxID=536013 RepID=A0AAN9Y2Q6_9HEMI